MTNTQAQIAHDKNVYRWWSFRATFDQFADVIRNAGVSSGKGAQALRRCMDRLPPQEEDLVSGLDSLSVVGDDEISLGFRVPIRGNEDWDELPPATKTGEEIKNGTA